MRRSLLLLSARLLGNQPAAAVSYVEPLTAQAACRQQQQAWLSRPYSQPAAAADQQQQQQEDEASEKVKQLAAEIMALSVLECSQLSRVLRDKLGVPRGSGMAMMPAMMAAGPAGAAAPAAGAAAEAPAEEKKEKTEFDVKLEGFSPEGKIKVIKEIRALTNLGLKEAKELVEKSPVVVKTSVSKGDAEAMKKQLEAAGAKVALE